MKRRNIKIEVDNEEYSLIIHALNNMRSKVLREDGPVEFVNEVMARVIKQG